MVQQKFEELFTKYDKTGKGGLTLWELLDMISNVRKISDPFGWSAAQFEWGSTYYVAKNKVCVRFFSLSALCALLGPSSSSQQCTVPFPFSFVS